MEEHQDSRRSAWSGDLEGELSWMQELACHLVRDREAARELVQDAWLQALERPPRTQDRPRAWISTVMRNLVRQVGRRSSRRGRVVGDGCELSDRRPQPFQELERAELDRLLCQELRALAEPYRSTLRDHFELGLSSAEIARRRGVPSGTVRWRLKTGLDRLRLRLDERYGGRVRWISAWLALVPREHMQLSSRRPTPRKAPPRSRPFARLGSLSLAGLAVLAGGTALRVVAPDARARSAALHDVAAAPRAAEQTALEPRPAEPGFALEMDSADNAPATAAPVDPRAPEPTALRVRVTAADGAPLGGAELCVATPAGFEARTTSAADGWARVPLLPHDVGALAIPAARDHVALRARAPGRATSDVLFVPRARIDDPNLAVVLVEPERVLDGRVTDEQGAALAGVDVFALADPHHTSLADPRAPFSEALALGTRTGEDGSYALVGLGAREQVLCVRRPGEESLLVPVQAGESHLHLRLAGDGTLRGRIADEHGRPVRGARVWVEPLQRGTEWCAGLPGYEPALRGFSVATTTDADGNYELRGVHPRERRVYACSVDEPDLVASAVVNVAPRGPSTWDAVLEHSTGIRLSLRDREDLPLSGWIVQLVSGRSAGPSWVRWIASDASGMVSVPEARGEADLVVYDENGLGAPWLTQHVRATPEPWTLAIDERRFGLVFGRVVDASGSVPAGARLAAIADGARVSASIRIDPVTGRFRGRLECDTYELVLLGEHGGAPLCRATVEGGGRAKLGPMTAPDLGELRLHAELPANRSDGYRLSVCFAGAATRWKDGALPLLAAEQLHAGLYRLDAPGTDGIQQSGWARVRPHEVAELDFERLTRVLVEVLAEDGPARAALVVREPGASAPAGDEREPECRVTFSRRADGRFLHVLRLPPGRWTVAAQLGSEQSQEATVEVADGVAMALQLDAR